MDNSTQKYQEPSQDTDLGNSDFEDDLHVDDSDGEHFYINTPDDEFQWQIIDSQFIHVNNTNFEPGDDSSILENNYDVESTKKFVKAQTSLEIPSTKSTEPVSEILDFVKKGKV